MISSFKSSILANCVPSNSSKLYILFGFFIVSIFFFNASNPSIKNGGFIMESKKLMLKEKGMSENDLEHYALIHERNFRLWREKVIVTMINNYPSLYRNKFLPFNNWNGAAQYVNELIKLQRDVAKHK